MNNIFMKALRMWSASLIVLLSLSLAGPGAAAQNQEELKEGRKEARKAAQVFSKIMSRPDHAIPRELLEKAEAVGVFPDVVKAAFIFGGRGGDGVVARRMANGGWSVPVFYNMSGGSFGPQIGAKETDYIMLFMNDGALRDLLDDKLEFGGDASFAAGPVGRTVGAATNLTLDAGILTYSRSKGAFIGASLQGAVLTADNSINDAMYGMKANEILDDPAKVDRTRLPSELHHYIDTLATHGGTRPSSAETRASSAGYMMLNATYSNNPREPAMNDLVREVRRELLMMPYYSVFDWIEFEVGRDGTVILRGSVVTPPDKISSAEKRVSDIEGVTGVVNNIEALPLSPMDDRLRERLYREIYSGSLFRYQVGALQQIHIIVDRGKVTLEGVVDSESDKNVAGMKARGVSGVFSVDNQLMVHNRGAF